MYRPTTFLAAVASLAAAVVGITTVSSDAGASGDCSLVRTYGFTTVVNDAAWASIVGHMGLYDSDDGQHEYTLTLNDRHEEYLRESIAGGCAPEVAYQTRTMTSVLNLGTSWYSGTATLNAGESGSVAGSRERWTCAAASRSRRMRALASASSLRRRSSVRCVLTRAITSSRWKGFAM